MIRCYVRIWQHACLKNTCSLATFSFQQTPRLYILRSAKLKVAASIVPAPIVALFRESRACTHLRREGGGHSSVGEGDSRIEDPGNDGEPGDLAVNIGDLTTPEDSSLAERNREAVQHLYQPYYKQRPLSRTHACCREVLFAGRPNIVQAHLKRCMHKGRTGTKRHMAITNQNHLTVVTTDTAPRYPDMIMITVHGATKVSM